MLALFGIVAIAALQALRIPGAIVLEIVAISGASWALGATPLPERWWSVPSLPTHTLGALGFSGLFTGELLAAILAFVLVDLLDTAGTLMGVGQLAGLVEWTQPAEAVPAFLTATVMPFTGSIANGFAAGIISWVAIRLLTGRLREIRWDHGAGHRDGPVPGRPQTHLTTAASKPRASDWRIRECSNESASSSDTTLRSQRSAR